MGDILEKYIYRDGNSFSYKEYIKLGVSGWEIHEKP
jgi:hypothetical protein